MENTLPITHIINTQLYVEWYARERSGFANFALDALERGEWLGHVHIRPHGAVTFLAPDGTDLGLGATGVPMQFALHYDVSKAVDVFKFEGRYHFLKTGGENARIRRNAPDWTFLNTLHKDMAEAVYKNKN